MAKRQSVRIRLKDGGEVEVPTVAKAEALYPDATIVHVTTIDDNGHMTSEPYKKAKQAKDDKPAPVPAATED